MRVPARGQAAFGAVIALSVCLIAVVASCGSDTEAPAAAPSTTTSTTFPGDALVGDAVPEAGSAADGEAATLAVAARLEDALTAVTVNPVTGSMYVATRPGQIWRVRHLEREDGTVLPVLDGPMVQLPDVPNDGELGLLGLAVSPDGSNLYLHYSGADNSMLIGAVPLDGDVARVSDRTALLAIAHPTNVHNGGQLAVSDDGTLWIGTGDGGYDPDGVDEVERAVTGLSENAQRLDSLLGKVLRIQPTPGEDEPYTVPADNPFAAGGGEPEIWANGFRNPWAISFDSATGDLWVADVGDFSDEEVNRLPADGDLNRGGNFGWDQRQGFDPGFPPNGEPGTNLPYLDPVFTYDHGDGRCAVIGGAVYHGELLPFLEGAYVFTDFCDGVVRTLRPDGGGGYTADVVEGIDPIEQPTSIATGADGELYITTLGGTLFRIDPDT